MNTKERFRNLSEFLTTHRARIQPMKLDCLAEAGGVRLACAEKKSLRIAGVSTTWYTWLEQGRDIKMSVQVLDRIALALQLNEDERQYLFMLALEQPAPTTFVDNIPTISPALIRILTELHDCPTIISDRRCHIVGWNQAGCGYISRFCDDPCRARKYDMAAFYT